MKYLTLALMALAMLASSREVTANASLAGNDENEASYDDEVAFGNRKLSGKGKGKGRGKSKGKGKVHGNETVDIPRQ